MKLRAYGCLLLLCLVAAACGGQGEPATATAATPAQPAVESQAPAVTADQTVARVSIEDTRRGIENGRVTLIDVRSAEQYQAGHLPGALHFPPDRIRKEIKTLPGDRMIVAYCT